MQMLVIPTVMSNVFWFGFFVKWHINLCRLFNAKAILQEELKWYYLTHGWEVKGVHTFLKGICPKVKYELAYYDSAVHRFNHYTTRTPPTVINALGTILKSLVKGLSIYLSIYLFLYVCVCVCVCVCVWWCFIKIFLGCLMPNPVSSVGLGRRIHRLHLCRGLRLPERVSCLWH